jgi:hypothetical protein
MNSDGTAVQPSDRTEQWSVGRRWTPEIAERGFTPVAQVFLESHARLGLSATESLMLIHLFSFRWDNRAPHPSLGTLGKRLGLSQRSVRRMVCRLERLGFLKRVSRARTSNAYDVGGLLAALEEIAQEPEPAERAVT